MYFGAVLESIETVAALGTVVLSPSRGKRPALQEAVAAYQAFDAAFVRYSFETSAPCVHSARAQARAARILCAMRFSRDPVTLAKCAVSRAVKTNPEQALSIWRVPTQLYAFCYALQLPSYRVGSYSSTTELYE